ncbi:hypothetical protein QVD17_26246 [Tagetes erecta]|uniref:Uncharacterized protein n=1 Tax=Tagetes erecta TaxID=13708 RepID=A0AAD8NPX4_TARER|nr:hypothetical protein QVD17_26246 [Tagetes erecta]
MKFEPDGMVKSGWTLAGLSSLVTSASLIFFPQQSIHLTTKFKASIDLQGLIYSKLFLHPNHFPQIYCQISFPDSHLRQNPHSFAI